MNRIWITVLLASMATALYTNPSLAVSAMLQGSNDAVRLCISLAAVYAFWLGFLNVLDKLGAAELIAKMLRPVIRLLFGKSIKPETAKYISINMSANLLGLGNASTPMGIKAINSMDDGSGKATPNMLMLFVISATSLQIFPSTVIGMRASHGSLNAADFLPACIAATIASTILGAVSVKLISALCFSPSKAKNRKRKLQKDGKQTQCSPNT